MLFQRISRSDPEKIFVVVRNSSATAMTNGQAVNWDFITDYDGVGVCRPLARATNAGAATAGIVAETIAISGYGLVQVYGYHSAVRMRVSTDAVALADGKPLVMNAAGSLYCLETFTTASTAGGIEVIPCAFVMNATSTLWTTIAASAFIKAL